MDMNLNSLTKINEGKTKIVYANAEDDGRAYLFFKDDITAGDGLKHDVIEGKALIDWQINRDVFEFLNRSGFQTHYVASPQERFVLVKKLDRKIDLEVVSRRVAAGSILKWGKVAEGTKFDPVITQFHYKDDPLHDPMLDDAFIDYLIETKGATEFAKMREINAKVLICLEEAFSYFKFQLVDLKLEYGVIEGDVYIIDEVSGGSLRLWPYAHENPNLNQSNVLSALKPEGRLDKDTYRMGERFDDVKSKFIEIQKITEQFKTLPPLAGRKSMHSPGGAF